MDSYTSEPRENVKTLNDLRVIEGVKKRGRMGSDPSPFERLRLLVE
ncbi:hypothetical protein PY254_16730 [Rhodanobacter sp. AS-Z3]|nr:hypothetical protein [Rhodanobacter sp. AS-Z3]WEN14855.1 hypothetical protein PY254_16730 [Rhodanobacter sp. AS-Z3]